jgi:hypothetical protein
MYKDVYIFIFPLAFGLKHLKLNGFGFGSWARDNAAHWMLE